MTETGIVGLQARHATFGLDGRTESVPAARRFVAERLAEAGLDDLVPDAALVATELVSNALLHAAGTPATLHLDLWSAEGDRPARVRIGVEDANPAPPLPRLPDQAGTTGRGLSLVIRLSAEWGVDRRPDGSPGKLVWALVVPEQEVVPPDDDGDGPGLDALLAMWPDDEPTETLLTVDIGDAPTSLMLAAKEHLDGLVREITLATVGDATGVSSRMPPGLAESIDRAVQDFGDARRQIRRLCQEAVARGDERVRLVLHVPAAIAEIAEAYLGALAEADEYARDARLLTLESPVEYRVLRQWYGEALVREARRLLAGAPAVPLPTFEERLVAQLRLSEARLRSTGLTAKLQQVTAALAAAQEPAEIADIVVREGTETLGAAGGLVAMLGPDLRIRPYGERGEDEGLTRRYQDLPGDPYGPSRSAIVTGQPVFVESREERDARFPHLGHLQPDAVSFAALPLRAAGDVVGVLRFSFSTARIFDNDERAYLLALAGQTALAIARTRALGELQQLRDELQLMLSSGQLADPARPSVPDLLSSPSIASIDIAMLRTLYGDAPIGVAVLSPEGRYLRVNRVVAEAHHGEAGQQVGRTLEEVLGEDAEPLRDRLDRVVTSGRPVTEEDLRLLDAQGVLRTWRTSWFPVRSGAGRVDAVLLVTADVTGQQWAEDLRRRAEERNRVLASTGALFAEALDVERTLDAVCELLVPMLGQLAVIHLLSGDRLTFAAARHRDPIIDATIHPLLEAISYPVDDVLGPGPVVTTGETIRASEMDDATLAFVEAERPHLLPVLRAIGPGSAAIVPLVARNRILGTMTVMRPHALDDDDVELLEDVARRAGLAVANAQALAASTRLELALTAADMGSFAWQVATEELPERLVLDDRMCFIIGVEPADWQGKPNDLLNLVVPEDRRVLRDLVDHAVETAGEIGVQFRVRAADGPVRWVWARGRAVAGPDGTVAQVLGTAIDNTEVRESRDRVVRALEHMADSFISFDRDWAFTYVNMAAERMLGLRRDEMLGRSFWDVFPEAVGRRTERLFRQAMVAQTPTQVDVRYVRRHRHFEARLFPSPDGLSVYFSDVGAQRLAEAERDRANARLAVLDRVGEAVAETLDVDEGLARLADALVPGIATLVTIDLHDSENRPAGEAIVVGSALAEVEAMRSADALAPRRSNPRSAVHQVLSGGQPQLVQYPVQTLGATLPASDEQRNLWSQVPMRSALIVPLTGRGNVLGAITLMRTLPDQPLYTDDDLTLAIEIGRRAGVMIDNAARYTTQRRTAETLQRSLLPDLPRASGIELAAHYVPSSAEALVGGDWYDAFPVPGGGLGVVIGDVMGHDMAAATAMGQLRSVVRTCAVDGDPPSEVLDRLDRLVDTFGMADLATLVYARLDRHADGSATLTYGNAGHPPPLLVTADGRTRFLREAGSTMIGAPGAPPHDEAAVPLPPGSIVLMYTDGLVERRRSDLGERLEVFRNTTEVLWEEHTELTGFAAALMAEMQRDSHSEDDAALLAIRVTPEKPTGLERS